MKFLKDFFIIAGTVGIAVAANSVGTLWARDPTKITIYTFLLLLISPLVFITFGLVANMRGVSIASGVVDSLLVLSTMAVGLIFFGEWNKLSSMQFLGMGFALLGIILMLYFPKSS